MGWGRQLIQLAAFATVALLAGCAHYDDPYYVHSVWRPADAATKQADVFFLTDRKPNPNWLPDRFDRVRDAPSCGIAHEAIPPARLPAGDPLLAFENKDRQAIACGESQMQFAAAIAQAAHAKNCNEVLIFIHGFDTEFETALLRAGQLASDAQWRCVAVAFSWTSTGNRTTYDSDLANAIAAEPLLADFLRALSNAGLRTDIIAHSMGAKLALGALAQTGARADNVVFAAPDIGVSEFAPLLQAAAPQLHRLTIYASHEDAALAISKRLNGGQSRLGRSPAVAQGVADVIDAHEAHAELIGHEYYGLSYEVVSDMALALAGVPLAARASPPDGRAPTLLRDDTGLYRVNVSWSREPDFFTWLFRFVAGLIAL